ncbi:hypothetical protein GOP47_0005220 [Adiantum capillus-veneris]|uniref:Uncharacterized protein n=1 Tax=Adiantum capillus-veneris TaxID=13818 RepID=A0A9D4V4P8_ADICA|nr:hypothetical protein GOP47_0005220 [Adiantum capillus-veneris]
MASSLCSCPPHVYVSSSSASSLARKHGQPPLPFIRATRTFSCFSSSQHGVGQRSESVSSAAVAAASSSSSPSPLEDEGFEETSDDPIVEQPAEGVAERAWKMLKTANSFLPQVVMASTLLALMFPPSFTWFTNRYYAPALGFLMFAVGINLDPSNFIHAFQRPWILAAGYLGQFVIKPILGVLFATIGVSFLHLPPAIGSGMILVSCVSGAQLSNYATFLVEPDMVPLSIVMTAISTATAVFVTPALTLLLLGKRLPVDVYGMIINITQIVVAPIVAGIALNRFADRLSRSIRPVMPLLSVIVTSLCVGSPLAMNIEAVQSPFGFSVLVLVFGFHAASFLLGFQLAKTLFWKSSDVLEIQKTISFETGMQSSLLGLALANRFFADPLVGLPSAISTVLMSLMGFTLVLYWNKEKERAAYGP